jgi:hypothetical protein
MRSSLVLTIALLGLLAFPALGAAKGPSTATMSGPGISGLKHFNGDSEGGPSSPLGTLAMSGGFFPQVFEQIPDPTLTAQPKGDLGPRYTVTYVVPGPSGKSVLHQDFYPYAKPAPLTYMKPGITFWGVNKTHGGWFVTEKALPRELGLPAQPPRTSGGTHLWRWSGIGGGVLLLAAAVGLLLIRLRPRGAKPVSA